MTPMMMPAHAQASATAMEFLAPSSSDCTTVRQPMEAAGYAMVEALIEQIEGGRPQPRTLVTELVVRESTKSV